MGTLYVGDVDTIADGLVLALAKIAATVALLGVGYKVHSLRTASTA